jgi:hypothetical protein
VKLGQRLKAFAAQIGQRQPHGASPLAVWTADDQTNRERLLNLRPRLRTRMGASAIATQAGERRDEDS